MDQRSVRTVFAAVMIIGVVPTSAFDGITTLSPFVGERREPLNGPVGPFGFTIVGSQDIFGGAMTVTTPFRPTTYVHYWLGSSFNGDPVSSRTGAYVLGTTQGPQEWLFPTPVRRIGSYFNNNSGANDATVEFFGPSGQPLGTRVADIRAPGNTWTWNGWESDVPISRMLISGNGALNGFIWMDDMELSFTPAPGSALALAAGAMLARSRRRVGPVA